MATKQSTTVNALAQLIGHCREAHPHFESSRGQLDIENAIAERRALVDALKLAEYGLEQCELNTSGQLMHDTSKRLVPIRAALALALGEGR